MPVVDRDVIQVIRNMGERVDLDLIRFIPPAQIRDVFEGPLSLEGVKELQHGFFGRIAPNHKIDTGIFPKDLFMIIGC